MDARKLLSQARKGVVFRADRDATLRSLDIGKLQSFFHRWSQDWPKSFDAGDDALAAMHFSRLGIPAFDPAEKLFSALWLVGHKRDLPDGMSVLAHKPPAGDRKTPVRYELVGAEYEK